MKFFHLIMKYSKNFRFLCTSIENYSKYFGKNEHQGNDSFQKKILYSSVQNSNSLGYKSTKKFESLQRKLENKSKLNKISIRPFPKVLDLINNQNSVHNLENQHENQTTHEKINCRNIDQKDILKKWMHDYEYFDESEEYHSQHGTPDYSIPPSTISCSGCGAFLHCTDPALSGYIPSEIFRGRTNNELKNIICQRCHFLKTYNIALDISITADKYIEILSSIKDKFALVILIVDLLDIPCSIWPGFLDIIGNKRPVFLVGNKVDLLPKDSKGYLNGIKKALLKTAYDAGLNKTNCKHVSLISAKTGYGIEELITQLHNFWRYDGDVYLIGCTNVGKSSLFNSLLKSDYCKVQARDLVKKATACPWPGTTLRMLKFPILRPSDIRVYERYKRISSERYQRFAENKLRNDQLKKTGKIEDATLIGNIGLTFSNLEEKLDHFNVTQGTNVMYGLEEKSKKYAQSHWCYDTPGVIQSDQIYDLLTTEELLDVMPKEMITPRSYVLKQEMSLFLAGLGRLDYLSGDLNFVRITVYSSGLLPVLITSINDAAYVYEKLLGSELLRVPRGDIDRLKKWPQLKNSGELEIKGCAKEGSELDIVLSTAGWLGINIPIDKIGKFRAWTPEGRGIFLRSSLIPLGYNLRGKRIRGTLAYNIGKPFIK